MSGAFRRLWLAVVASGLATWALPFVLGLALVEGRLGATALGVLLAVRTVGFVAATAAAGVIADLAPRRTVVRVSGVAAAAGTAALAVLLDDGLLVASVGAAVAGAGQGACRPAFQALVADVVEPERRRRANALVSLATRVSVVVAPAVAALLVPLVGVTGLLVGVTVLWLVAAGVTPSGAAGSRGEHAGFLAELRVGLQEARRHPWFLGGLGALATVIALGYSATGVVLPLVAAEGPGGPALLAASATAYTVGAVLVGVVLTRTEPRPAGWWSLAGLGAYAVVPLALVGPAPAWAIVLALGVAGAGIELFNVPWFTAVQREVPPERLARVSSLDFVVSYGLAPLCLALLAPAVDGLGREPVMLAAAAACLAATALAAATRGARHFAVAPSRAATG